MLERGGKTYLNTSESAELLGVTLITFKSIAREFHLEPHKFVGQGKSIFYLEDDIRKIRDTPLSVQEAEE